MEPPPPPPVSEPPPESVPPTSTSLVARLGNVLAAPAEVFDEVKAAPFSSANWLVPALLLIVVSWISAYLIFSQSTILHQLTEITDKAIQQRIEQSHLSEQQADQAREAGVKWTLISAKIGAGVFPVLVAFATPFWWGLIFWLVGTKALKGDFPYMKGVEAAGLAAMITLLDAIVRTLLILVKGDLYASPSLMLLVDFDPQNTVHSLLALANVMTFWLLAVRALGLARLSGASFAKAAAWVFGIWAAFSALGVGFALAGKAVGKAFSGGSS